MVPEDRNEASLLMAGNTSPQQQRSDKMMNKENEPSMEEVFPIKTTPSSSPQQEEEHAASGEETSNSSSSTSNNNNNHAEEESAAPTRTEASSRLRFSCLKKATPETEPPAEKKVVQFAPEYTEQEYEKESQTLRETLFWTRDELLDNNAEARDALPPRVEVYYAHALESAYEASASALNSSEQIDMDWDTLATCSRARGLELEMFPGVKKFARKHRQAVLTVQRTLRDDGQPLFDDLSLSLIRKASLKYSRPLRLVAAKMAELDTRYRLQASFCNSSMASDSSFWSTDDDDDDYSDVCSYTEEDVLAEYDNFQLQDPFLHQVSSESIP